MEQNRIQYNGYQLALVMDELDIKYASLKEALKKMERVVVAFSGGVDSTLLLEAARETLGAGNVLAVTAFSATTPEREQREAEDFAGRIGVEHYIVKTRELEMEEFTRNPAEKCYICKKHRFGMVGELALSRGISRVLDGENADDAADYRPGSRASRELGVISPLREAGLTKLEVRLLSKRLDLPTWDKPAVACLASRIPYGQTITPEKLGQVDAAEIFLFELGFQNQVRVRHYGHEARIELDENDIPKIAAGEVRERVIAFFRQLGFRRTTLDLAGYRMGSLNEALEKSPRVGDEPAGRS